MRSGLVIALCIPAAVQASFVTFESGQVRPLALSPSGGQLFAVNTPDNRLEIFAVGSGGLTHTGSVPVGMEPVAVAARTNAEVWVVNHLSDSISIVDVGASPPRVTRTLLVGDEPRDIVFAGPGGGRAFITTAHRGQNSPVDPQLTTAGVGRADVWVFDAANLGTTLGGTPLTIVTLFGDTPRALAASPDGNTVYAAVFHSGNRTTCVTEGAVCNGGSGAPSCSTGPGGLPAPNTNFQGILGPETGLIVKFNPSNSRWEDRLGRNWNNGVKFSLPDRDVFTINASAATPAQTGFFTTVGTVIFNMVANPVSGKVYVANTEARNEVRFEGPGIFGGSTVRGHLHEARVSVLQAPSTVTPRHLNKHINYAVVPSPPGVEDDSLAIPTGMAVTSDGATLYVAAFGSSKIGVFDTAQLEANTFVPDAATHITLTGGGPSGLVLDEPRDRLYAFTRFDNAISVVDTVTGLEIAHLPVHNPEPAHVVVGRPVLYDALGTSSNGETSCASCHVFGDLDSLAWDLGNPDDTVLNNPNPIRVPDPFGTAFQDFHPLKGPMTTQSLRGMANHGPMHWRGDRTGGNDIGGNALDEDAAFRKFIIAFEGLLGNDGPIDGSVMGAFADFILEVTYPPNPIRALDNSLTPDQQAGRTFFFGPQASDVFQPCNGCHALSPASGFFGSDGFSSFENEPQFVKIPHLRNLYQKVGMFGMPAVPFLNSGDNGNKGNQIRGFGFLHDGSVDTVLRFLNATVFNQTNPGGVPVPNPGGFPNGAAGDPLRRQVEQFMLAFDSNLAPIVGQQTTLTTTNGGIVGGRIDLLIGRAALGECDVTVKGPVAGQQRGWHRLASGLFRSDRASEPLLSDLALRALATAGQELTYTCAPPGSGLRMGVDRDEDGFFDRDEVDAGSDPADPNSVPGGTTSTTATATTTTSTTTTTLAGGFVLVQTKQLALKDDSVPPLELDRRRRVRFTSITTLDPAPNRIVPPLPGGAGDPTLGGATLVVYNSNPAPGSPTDEVTVALPAPQWSALGKNTFAGWIFRDPAPGAPIKRIKVKQDRISVRGGQAAWGYTLDEPSQGRVAVRLTLGTTGWCAAAPAKLSGTGDKVDKFVAQPRTPAPSSCPVLKP